MSKICKQLYKMINGIYGILLLVVVSICLFAYQTDYSYKKEFLLPNWQYALLGIICFAGIALLVQAVSRVFRNSKHPDRVMMAVSVLFGGCLIFLSYHYYFKTGWDAQVVEGTAKCIAYYDWEAVQNKYFSYYPNNVFLTFIFSCVVYATKLVGFSNYYFGLIAFQCVLFAWTGYLLYRCAKMLMNTSWAVTVWLFYVALVGMSPWVIVPYSDATGLIFPVGQVYLFLRIRQGEKKSLCSFLLAFLCYLGYHIKPQSAIVGIAVVLVMMLTLLEQKEKDYGKLAKELLYPILGILLGIGIAFAGVKATRLELDEELTFGMPHFLMMGLNEEYNGVINIEDQNFSMSFTSAKERNRANLEVAARRIKEQGASGLLELWKKKLLTNFADGTFAWWEEGEFYSQEMYDGNYALRNFLTSYYYKDREGFEDFKNFTQTLWMGCLVLAVLAVAFPQKMQEINVLRLSIIGITLFELIFEARARYLFLYAPLFLLLAVAGMYSFVQKIMKQKRAANNFTK